MNHPTGPTTNFGIFLESFFCLNESILETLIEVKNETHVEFYPWREFEFILFYIMKSELFSSNGLRGQFHPRKKSSVDKVGDDIISANEIGRILKSTKF